VFVPLRMRDDQQAQRRRLGPPRGEDAQGEDDRSEAGEPSCARGSPVARVPRHPIVRPGRAGATPRIMPACYRAGRPPTSRLI